jgi:hypothetical protein
MFTSGQFVLNALPSSRILVTGIALLLTCPSCDVLVILCDSKLLSGFPWPVNGNPDIESHQIRLSDLVGATWLAGSVE